MNISFNRKCKVDQCNVNAYCSIYYVVRILKQQLQIRFSFRVSIVYEKVIITVCLTCIVSSVCPLEGKKRVQCLNKNILAILAYVMQWESHNIRKNSVKMLCS